jgi:pyruvate dehydrogenase E1 component beta subunit
MVEELQRDDKVFLMGEEVAYYHGAYKISKGLIDKFGPTRIWDTPITEAGFTGLGVGAALMGLRPIIEFMTMNFAMQGIDHIVNSMAKTHYMSSGILSGSIVFRGLNGPAAGVAAQHSQCYASWFGNIPGLVTLSPYDAADCRGLLKSAIRGHNPVVFLENEWLYGEAFEVDEHILSPEYLIPIGQARIMRPGEHVTIIAYARNVKFALQAADELAKEGISAEVVNLRSIKPLDRKTIIESVRKTHRAVSVEDGFPQCGVGSEIAAILFECTHKPNSACFDDLDAPMQRVTAIDIPMPYAKNLEEITTPNASHIVKAVKSTLKGVKL